MEFLRKLLGGGKTAKKVDLTRRFELLNRVGQGTMSKVWRAKDTLSGRTVALKVLDREMTQQFEARFRGLNKPSEGEIAVQLQHPNIVATFEHGLSTGDEPFLVMEYLDGVSLSFLIDSQDDVMQRHRLKLAIQLGEAIDYFHRSQWIHRDICPPNVIVTRDHQAKLIDFGLVVPNTPEFRRPGNRTGKSNYMAPELIRRQPTDQRIDVFSYAVTCFEMWTGQLPWKSGDTLDQVVGHLNQPPAQLQDLAPKTPQVVAKTIMRGLSTNPKDRWASTGEMVKQFRAAQA